MSAVAIRPPAVSGAFYPADPDELRRIVDRDLAAADPGVSGPPPQALIAPHAGYIYSGPVAASAYSLVRDAGDPPIQRVVLIGPAHRVPVHGIAASSAEGFETPIGIVPCDTEARDELLAHPAVSVDDRAHAPEHSLEVHLPFLQRTLRPGWRLLPLVVGRVVPEEVAEVLDLVWDGPETLVVASSDLSHYHPYEEALRLDRRTAERIREGSWVDLGPEDACGALPVAGLLHAAYRRGLDVELVDLRNSGDTAGPRDRVVGYGAFALR